MAGRLLTRGKHLHGRIISLLREFWAYAYNLTPPPLIEMPAPNQEYVQACICLLGVPIWHLSVIFLLNSGTCETVWYFLLFILQIYISKNELTGIRLHFSLN